MNNPSNTGSGSIAQGQSSSAAGERGIAAGSVSGSTIATGDNATINNIIIVGRFLEFAQVEGLLPQIKSNDFSSIAEAVDGAVNTRLDTDLADAVAFAGEVIGDFFIKNKDIQGSPVPLGEILDSLITVVVERLTYTGYWNAHCEPYPSESIWSSSESLLVLDTTEALYKKYFCDSVFFALHSVSVHYGSATGLFVDGYTHNTNQLQRRFTPKQLRVIIVGIVLDLIRIKSEDKISYQFLQDMENMFNQNKHIPNW